ncbi:hypothetical protein QUF88_12965 [Bacillus sp. DX1.1]|uniref:hypothetical protein n=1 Tax=unclassified Bacillus (in: firmicutes) TaxID=185979 RepID=UPI002570E716|nr:MULTISPECIES: hypothetical protein [unclassified Bacillus (in: firmicutes)]MDM5154708.1 hypothetical protein [Bacillus sp. DX1.1]WJE83596.1 hypothetical protein QRE67_10460 [Bacillus sp. DX3.1]
MSSKLQEGVSFVTSKTKSLVNKVGDLWNKGKTTVKNAFVQADKKIQHAIKTLVEYKWIPGGDAFSAVGVGKVGGSHSLKDAYQYMKDTGERLFGSGEKDVVKEVSGANNFKIGSNAKNHLKNVENITMKKGISGGHNADEFYKALSRKQHR